MNLERLAPAKINLGLRVLRKRPDGFHDLETVFLGIPWFDRIVLTPADALRMTCSDPALPTDEGNLCLRAAQALARHVGTPLNVQLHLEKNVPYGAGLGSGSSDAATTLLALIDYFGLEVPRADVHALAASLGSDVAFFLDPVAAIGTGRGEVLHPLLEAGEGSRPYTLPFALVVAVPDCHVSTAAAYRGVQPCEGYATPLASVVATNDLGRWRKELVNDFERSILPAFPSVAALRTRIETLGAEYVSMSGSGAAVFGVFSADGMARNAAERLKAEGFRVRGFDRATMCSWWRQDAMLRL